MFVIVSERNLVLLSQMRSIQDKGCCNQGQMQEISNGNFELHKGNNEANRTCQSHHRTALGKPTPSKWDDAQKWLVGLSRGGDKNQNKTKPRNSNADDLRLIAPVPQQEQDFSCEEDEDGEEGKNDLHGLAMESQNDVETKKIDCGESIWRISKAVQNSTSTFKSICLRDMGTEMTPIASQEPSRTATPIRATTPATRSPICSGSSTPVRSQHGLQPIEGEANPFGRGSTCPARRYVEQTNDRKKTENQNPDQTGKLNSLESKAMAWNEAERAKYMARYKREEVKIQAWENHQMRKAEMEMKKMEVKAERTKARAQERLANKLSATRRIAEEKRSNAEAKLNEKAVMISEKSDYMRRTGHLPSLFSFKLSSLCC